MESLSQAAHRRLYPSLTQPAYLALRSRRLIFASWARQLNGPPLKILDIGGRYQPYRPLFEPHIGRYFAVDLVQTEFVSAVADAVRLPFAPASFDMAIATQVFEYLQDPCEVARQIHAVLKPGGVLLASFAACTPRFGDDEYWRFTPSGLRLILAPFGSVEIVPELRSVGGLTRTINLGLETLVRYNSFGSVYRWTLCPLLNLFGLMVEKMNLTSDDRFTTNFSVRAAKTE
ncbi:MAG TPA: class I SAM-dependent methyltransferase [Candidatus Sulfotelmatobacter sp.]